MWEVEHLFQDHRGYVDPVDKTRGNFIIIEIRMNCCKCIGFENLDK